VERVVVVPAAGTGSRLGGPTPKLLVPVGGRPMIDRILSLYRPFADRAVIVVSPAADAQMRDHLPSLPVASTLVVQQEATGMLDAIMLARDGIERTRPRRVLVTWCDQVAIHPGTAAAVAEVARGSPAPDLVMPTNLGPDPYVHLVRGADGRIAGVLHRREGDAMPPLGESDAGVFDLSLRCFLEWLPQYAAAPAVGARTGERNFVPFAAWVAARGGVVTVPCREPEEAVGINTPDDLALVERHLRRRGTE
jgi:bifunctional UDP-N-acetylglucosamine pyrophosphorylase / glucosamine-1-phosphate N-acetyltransferase